MNKRERFQLWLIGKVPVPILIESFEAFFAFLALLVGVPVLFGYVPANSISRTLPLWGVYLWNGCLVFGALATILGISSIKVVGGHTVYDRLPTYKLGLRLLAIASGAYGIAIILVAGTTGLLASVPLLAFSLTCWVKLLRISTSQTLARKKDNE